MGFAAFDFLFLATNCQTPAFKRIDYNNYVKIGKIKIPNSIEKF